MMSLAQFVVTVRFRWQKSKQNMVVIWNDALE